MKAISSVVNDVTLADMIRSELWMASLDRDDYWLAILTDFNALLYNEACTQLFVVPFPLALTIFQSYVCFIAATSGGSHALPGDEGYKRVQTV